ncbi:MAG: oxidoreductase [Planctomycetes bacterium RBG_16_59_8]|nr:MAG: oxidoreductase [Planctomycetes bacterium RBG_16_59_8]
MPRRPFGSTGVEVPIVGIGTWMMERDGDKAVETLRRAVDEGATHIDTAEMYGSGEVERIVGKAIHDARDRVFLVSKVMPSNATYDGTIRACERSLKNLGTDRLDLYLLHWRESTPLAESFRAFDKLVADGKILRFGVSNFDIGDMEEAERVAGKGRIACNQVLYHLQERMIEFDIIPWCERHGMAVVAYSPYGQGDFPSPHSPGGWRLREIAESRKATPRQVALAFLLRQKNIFAIPKTSNVDRLLENIGAANLRLNDEEIRAIDATFPALRRDSLPML